MSTAYLVFLLPLSWHMFFWCTVTDDPRTALCAQPHRPVPRPLFPNLTFFQSPSQPICYFLSLCIFLLRNISLIIHSEWLLEPPEVLPIGGFLLQCCFSVSLNKATMWSGPFSFLPHVEPNYLWWKLVLFSSYLIQPDVRSLHVNIVLTQRQVPVL